MSHNTFHPHQLDFDWRFTNSATFAISEKIGECGNLLLVGCPSLMAISGPRISNGLLIERNPNHSGTEKFKILHTDIRFYETRAHRRNTFDVSVIDAPWYVDELLSWINLALAYTRRGGSIFFVLWPEDVRAEAKGEHRFIFSLLNNIGAVDNLGTISYEIPLFEKTSLETNDNRNDFYREGTLFSLTKDAEIFLPARLFKKSRNIWRRYQLHDNQLAIRLNSNDRNNQPIFDYAIEPFVLRNTSRRNSDLHEINAWTSENVVAKIKNPQFVDNQIRKIQRGVSSDTAWRFLRDIGLVSEKLQDITWGRTWLHRV